MKISLINSKKRAQSLIEYALILAMVAVVAIAALQLLGQNIGKTLQQATNSVGQGADQAGSSACSAMGDNFSWDSANNVCNYTGGSSDTTSP